MPKHLLSSLQTLGQGHRRESKGQCHRETKSPGEDMLGADSCQTLPSTCSRALLLTGSLHIFYLFLLISIANLPQEQGLGPASLWMGDSCQNNKTQHLALLKPGPFPPPTGHRSALKPHFIYLYTLPHSLFLATGAHDIVAWDMLEQGSGSPCKWWQQLPPGSRVLLTSSSGGL